jgi:hypothetical protein
MHQQRCGNWLGGGADSQLHRQRLGRAWCRVEPQPLRSATAIRRRSANRMTCTPTGSRPPVSFRKDFGTVSMAVVAVEESRKHFRKSSKWIVSSTASRGRPCLISLSPPDSCFDLILINRLRSTHRYDRTVCRIRHHRSLAEGCSVGASQGSGHQGSDRRRRRLRSNRRSRRSPQIDIENRRR